MKRGLDASEINQRAISKVAQALFCGALQLWPKPQTDEVETDFQKSAFPVQILNEGIDWGFYYRAAEDDVEAEKLQAYKDEVSALSERVDALEPDLPAFELELRAELGPVTDARTQAVNRFLSDLTREIAKVRSTAKFLADEKTDLRKEKMEQINAKLIMDAVFMVARIKAKKEAEAAKGPNPNPSVIETANAETVTEFGG
jgi:DNA repair exonuclease SbcCD ATPase subunit